MLTHVLPYVGGCPESVAVDHLVKAAREFCDRTRVWNYACDPILAEAGKSRYTLQFDAGTELVKVFSITVSDADYPVVPSHRGRPMARLGMGNFATISGPQDFQLSPAPGEGEPIVADIAVKPTLTNPADWPDDLAPYVDDIAHGAVATLSLIPRQEWTDIDAAAQHRAMFTDRIYTVSKLLWRGYGSNHVTMRLPL